MYSKTSLYHYRHLLQWCHNERDGISRRLYCLPHNFYRHRSKKTAKSRVTGLCEGNSPVTSEFPAQRSSNTENDSIWCRHHASKSRLNKPIYMCVCVCSKTAFHSMIYWCFWPHLSPNHHQTWYWLCKIGGSLFLRGKIWTHFVILFGANPLSGKCWLLVIL